MVVTVGPGERKCMKPGAGKTKSFKDCPECPEMVVVPAGGFTMGSPASEPQRSVDEAQVHATIARPFAVGKFAVTFDEWDACVAAEAATVTDPVTRAGGAAIGLQSISIGTTRRPMRRGCPKDRQDLPPAVGGRAGYVTRAGTTTPFWWGSSITPQQANYNGQRTVPVDSFEANPWGLYQVHGNIYEWTEDCWNDSNAGNPGSGSARTSGDCTFRAVRGGSWKYDPRDLRSASRYWNRPDYRNSLFGVRVARTIEP